MDDRAVQDAAFQEAVAAIDAGDIEGLDAGADVNAKDSAWDGTPLGWAEHCIDVSARSGRKRQYAEISAYLAERTSQ